MPHRFDAISEATLRRRQSAKWARFPADVLPAWVAEMDFPIAEPIRSALRAAIDGDDVGYAYQGDLGEAFARFAEARWSWRVDPADVFLVPDVMTGLEKLLQVVTAPGDRVVIEPPVYAPFGSTIEELGRVVVETPMRPPLAGARERWSLDLDAVERAYAAGAKAHVLCSPHNPTGRVHTRAELARLTELAVRHGVVVLSDEIHAPLTLPGATHVPLPCVSEDARRCSIVLTSASKTWNLAGLKAAQLVAGGEEMRALLAKLPPETPYHAGHLGVLGAKVAFTEGEPWREEALAALDRNRALLGDLLGAHVPSVSWVPMQASYLAWLDCTALGLGDDPARAFLEHGRVALSPGPTFGTGGAGFARLNIATTAALLEEAVVRMARAWCR
jgi:cystathionine beta-lyase